jgi:SM-20-related protein
MQIQYSLGGVTQSNEILEFSRSDIQIYDDLLNPDEQAALLQYLSLPGWGFGAYSDPSKDASRYWYKHFAGYFNKVENNGDIEAELERNSPLVFNMWKQIRDRIFSGHALVRCYANGYPFGSEGSVHMDANVSTHFTGLYYPHLAWDANYAGETVFFDRGCRDIIASIYPKPNRFVVFPGTIPHVARGVSRRCRDLRITLMFKTEKLRTERRT